MSIELVTPSNHLILGHPLLLLPLIPPSIRVFSNESVLHIRWPKYWSFSFSISPSNEYSGLISFRMDWLDLLAVQGTLKSLLQHHSSKTSFFRCSAFFIDQLLHPYMTTGKTIALTRLIFVGKVMSLLFNMQSRLTIDLNFLLLLCSLSLGDLINYYGFTYHRKWMIPTCLLSLWKCHLVFKITYHNVYMTGLSILTQYLQTFPPNIFIITCSLSYYLLPFIYLLNTKI